MKLPGLLADVNAELHRRDAVGACVDVYDAEPEVLLDETRGVFLRMSFVLTDGSRFTIDTLEAAEMLRALLLH